MSNWSDGVLGSWTGQADDVEDHLLGNADQELLAGVGLDRGQPPDVLGFHRAGAGTGDDQAPGGLTGGNPLRWLLPGGADLRPLGRPAR